MAETQIKKVSHRHDVIIDWLMAHPEEKNLQALCETINVSRSWISVVMNSDAFKAEYAKRRAEYQGLLAEGVQAKLHSVAFQALGRLEDILDSEELDPRFVLDAMDKTVQKLGYSPGAKAGVTVNVSQAAGVTPDILAEARARMKTITSITVDAESE